MDEFIEESVPAPAPAPEAEPTQPIDLDELVGGDAAPAEAAPAPATDAFNDDDAWMGTYTPAAPVAAAPVEPAVADPRVAWRKANAEALKKKDAEEAKIKEETAKKAAEHLKKVVEARVKTLSTRKQTNRAASSKDAPDMGVLKDGTTWEKVNWLVNFNDGTHQKDVTRLKNTLISLKTAKA